MEVDDVTVRFRSDSTRCLRSEQEVSTSPSVHNILGSSKSTALELSVGRVHRSKSIRLFT